MNKLYQNDKKKETDDDMKYITLSVKHGRGNVNSMGM